MQNCVYIQLSLFVTVNKPKTGSIGIDITFGTATDAAYQMLTYCIYPKVALIDLTGNCTLIDNI